jgi:hypothetical protein
VTLFLRCIYKRSVQSLKGYYVPTWMLRCGCCLVCGCCAGDARPTFSGAGCEREAATLRGSGFDLRFDTSTLLPSPCMRLLHVRTKHDCFSCRETAIFTVNLRDNTSGHHAPYLSHIRTLARTLVNPRSMYIEAQCLKVLRLKL